jgi:dihydrofolate reductase
MRQIIYSVATSLDGYIAGLKGEIDWIVPDSSVDFASVYARFDTVLLGRRTYELTQQPGAPPWPSDWRVFVFSRTLSVAPSSQITVVRDDAEEVVAGLRAESGRDIWLFGGGKLCGSLMAAGLVDRIEVAIMPTILGAGVRLVGHDTPRVRLRLIEADPRPNGIVRAAYEVETS